MLQNILEDYFIADATPPAVIIAFDLNFFKTVNDTYGHHVGDQMLIAMAERLERVFYRRKREVIFRQGGDEFLVFMKSSNEERALECLDEMCASPLTVRVSEDTTAECTVSAGYVLIAGESRDTKAMLAAADEALYYVKKHGRKGFHKGAI